MTSTIKTIWCLAAAAHIFAGVTWAMDDELSKKHTQVKDLLDSDRCNYATAYYLERNLDYLIDAAEWHSKQPVEWRNQHVPTLLNKLTELHNRSQESEQDFYDNYALNQTLFTLALGFWVGMNAYLVCRVPKAIWPNVIVTVPGLIFGTDVLWTNWCTKNGGMAQRKKKFLDAKTSIESMLQSKL